MEQTILPIGNSAGIIIPVDLRSRMGLNPGVKIFLHPSPDYKSLVLSRDSHPRKSSVTPEFLQVLERVNKRYGPVFARLAKR
ncbi:hypothetical protein HYS82_03940 [Candidatus Amesbacteria bacterium]|nr:hypothetical protein [Candidatus Amesbacteria bacterium]